MWLTQLQSLDVCQTGPPGRDDADAAVIGGEQALQEGAAGVLCNARCGNKTSAKKLVLILNLEPIAFKLKVKGLSEFLK